MVNGIGIFKVIFTFEMKYDVWSLNKTKTFLWCVLTGSWLMTSCVKSNYFLLCSQKKFILYVEWKKVKHYIIHKFHPLHLFTFIILSYTLKVTLLKNINMAFCASKELVITHFLFRSFYFWHQVFMFNRILTYFFILLFTTKNVFLIFTCFFSYQVILLKGWYVKH